MSEIEVGLSYLQGGLTIHSVDPDQATITYSLNNGRERTVTGPDNDKTVENFMNILREHSRSGKIYLDTESEGQIKREISDAFSHNAGIHKAPWSGPGAVVPPCNTPRC